MGTLEILNLVFSTLFGAVMTLWKNAQEDKREERKYTIDAFKEQVKATTGAREYEGAPITEQSRIKVKKKVWTILDRKFGYEYSSNDSGKYEKSSGFQLTRRFIAIVCVFSIIVLPIVMPTFFDSSVTFGYVENSWSLLPWVQETPVIKWITIGDASKNIVITPVMSNIIINIIGMFFGNQVTKK